MVEGARLESVYAGNRIAGSNPALSANFEIFQDILIRCNPHNICLVARRPEQAYAEDNKQRARLWNGSRC